MINDRRHNCKTWSRFPLKLVPLLTAFLLLLLLPVASASHRIDAELEPVYTTGNISKTLNLALTNDNASSNSIWQVKIVKNGDYGAQCLEVEDWSLDAHSGYCTYTTTSKISPGEESTFELKVSTPADEGTYSWDIYTTDSASPNEGSSATVNTRVDTQPPLTTIDPNGTLAQGPEATFTFSCQGDQGEVQSGCFRSFYRVTAKDTCPDVNYTQGTSGSVACSGQVCQRSVCYYSIDQAGNWEEKRKSAPFVLDAAQPDIERLQVSPHFVVNETNYVRGTISLQAEVGDEGAGLDSVSFQITGEEADETCAATYKENETWTCALDTMQLADGSYTLTVEAEDKVGNQASGGDYEFYVSNQQPIIRLIEDATIRFTYSEEKLDKLKEESLQLYQYDEETGSWEEAGGELNAEENYVEVPLSDVSQYTLFGEMEGEVTNETEACQPNWSCTDWSDCTNGTRTRDCTDLNDCGTEEGRPVTVEDCEVTCQPDWDCDNWTNCTNGTRTRNCTDLEQCDTEEGKPVEIKGCEGCEENWVCTDWSEIDCTNGTKMRECIEWNNCASEDQLPSKMETIECGQEQPKPREVSEGMSARRKLGIAVLVILIVIIALVLYYR